MLTKIYLIKTFVVQLPNFLNLLDNLGRIVFPIADAFQTQHFYHWEAAAVTVSISSLLCINALFIFSSCPVCVNITWLACVLTCDSQKPIPVGAGDVTVRGPLVGGRVVLYADWHYLHLLLHSKDRATKYTLRGLPRLLWVEEMRPLLGPKPNDMTVDLHGKYF